MNRKLPLTLSLIAAGFPNPAEEAGEMALDIHEHLVKNPAATFFMRVQGRSMENAGVLEDDIVVVDRSLKPKSGDIVVAVIDSEFTLKRLKVDGDDVWLIPESEDFKPLQITEGSSFDVWGVVSGVVRNLLSAHPR